MLLQKCRRTTSVYVLACAGSGLRMQLVFMHTQLYSCIRRYVLESLRMWEWTGVRRVLSTCVGFDPRTWDALQKPYSAHFHLFFNHFTSICNSNTPFHHSCIWNSLYHFFIFILHQNTISLNFTWIMNLISSFFLRSSSKYIGSRSTNKVVEWFNLLAPETRDYIQEASFEPIISLLLEKSTSATLA